MKLEGLFYETYLLIYLAEGLARNDACLLRALGVDAAKIGLVVEQARCLLADRAQGLDDRVADRLSLIHILRGAASEYLANLPNVHLIEPLDAMDMHRLMSASYMVMTAVSYTHLAIFLGFLLSVLLFANITPQVRGILLGAILIVVVGAIDDVMNLNACLLYTSRCV